MGAGEIMALKEYKVGSAPWEAGANKQTLPKEFKVGEAPWELDQQEPKSQLQAVKTGIESGLTFGARPAIAGAAGALGSVVGTLQTPNLKNESFLAKTVRALKTAPQAFGEARQEAIGEQRQLAQEHPGSYLAGELGGSLLVPGGAIKAATGGAKGFLGAARLGAVMGGARAVGEAENLKEGISQVGTGIVLGAASEAAARGAGKAKDFIAQKLQKAAESNVVKASGAMLKDFRRIFGKGKEANLADTAFKENIITIGDDVASIAKKATLKADQYGKAIGESYKAAEAAISNPENLAKLSKEQVTKLIRSDLNPKEIADEFLKKANEELKGIAGGPQVLNRLQTELAVVKDLGESAGIIELNNYRRSVDDLINYSKQANEMTLIQDKLLDLRNFIKNKIEQRIDVIDDIGGSQIGRGLKEANRRFSDLIEISKIAKDRVFREDANKAFGLRQSITTAGGGIIGGVLGGDLESAAKGAAAGYSLKTIEKYGPAIMARAQQTLADKLKQPGLLSGLIKNNPQTYQLLLQKTADALLKQEGK